MSYDPTERAPQPNEQAPQAPAQQPPVTPPVYGQSNPSLPPYEPAPAQQPPATPAYGQSNPSLPPYGQPPQAPLEPTAYSQSSPFQPPYGQVPATPPAYSSPSNPGLPPYGQAPQAPAAPAYSQSNPAFPPYGQVPQAPAQQAPATPAYGQGNPAFPPYGQVPQAPAQQAPATPAYGQSNPSLPPYGQVPQTPVNSAAYPQYAQPTEAAPYGQQPVDPYAPAPQQVPGQPYQPGQPWAPYPSAPVAPKKKMSGMMIAIIIIVVILVLGGGGGGAYAYYLATRPKPVITTFTSTYTVGNTPAGASSTTFNVIGSDFTANSAITFLLDKAPVPGAQPAQSDSNGKVTATLTVTDAWGTGNHTLTAKDAAGYLTAIGKAFTIVVPGQAKTPGPNGAPTDSATGTVAANVQAGTSSGAITLNVTGSSNSGTVCASRDDGQPHTRSGTTSSGDISETIVQTCSGTYKGGKLSYTETVTSDKFTFTSGAANGVNCTAQTPYISAHMEGTFTSATSVSGSYSDDTVNFTCSLSGTSQSGSSPGQTGTWTGNASMQ